MNAAPETIGIILVTHGRIAWEFLDALNHIVGPQDNIEAINIGTDDDMEARRTDIAAAIDRVRTNKGVILLTDMFGGTPSNLAISLLGQQGAEVIAGVNLPMLIRLVSVRASMDLDQAVAAAQEAGRKYIFVASRTLEDQA